MKMHLERRGTGGARLEKDTFLITAQKRRIGMH